MYKYYNYNYNDCRYYEVAAPSHDHYTFNPTTQSWYEDILIDNKGYSFNQVRNYAELFLDQMEGNTYREIIDFLLEELEEEHMGKSSWAYQQIKERWGIEL